MVIYKVLTSLITVFSVGVLNAQVKSNEIPNLVVAICIDQLRGDYLNHFIKTFGEKGFKKMMSEGVVYSDLDYSFNNINLASALTTIQTGVNPQVHGITSPHVYNADYLQIEDVFYDKNYTAKLSLDKLSPNNLVVNTLPDMLKKVSNGISKIYSLTPSHISSLILSGRLGNAGYWIDNNSGKWTTSSYYTYYTPVIEQINSSSNSYSNFIWNTQWKPLKPIDSAFPYTKTKGSFSHYLASEPNPILLSKETPFANEYIVSSAIALIEKGELGRNITPDYLALQLYAGAYQGYEFGNETADLYFRLDQDLERFISSVDTYVGISNTLIVLFSTGYYDVNIQEDENVFFIDRNLALLNMYLSAKYGQGQNWIDKIYDNQIYLNKKLISQYKINLTEIRKDVANFMSEISGIKDAYSYESIFYDNQNINLKNGLFNKKAGDVILELQSGWVMKGNQSDNNTYKVSQKVDCPVIFYGSNLKPQKVNSRIDATEIAPSLAHILRIRPPNTNSKNTLLELVNNETNKK